MCKYTLLAWEWIEVKLSVYWKYLEYFIKSILYCALALYGRYACEHPLMRMSVFLTHILNDYRSLQY